MPDRKGRLTPYEIREAADRAMGLSGGAGMPSKQQINQALKMMRSPMPAYQEGGVTGVAAQPTGFVEENPAPPQGALMVHERPRMGSYVESETDVELMQAMDPGELPNQQSRGMDQLNEQELMLGREIAARKISQATRRMAEQGISREASMQAQMDRQQATDELQRIMDEMRRRGMSSHDGLFDPGGGFIEQMPKQSRAEFTGPPTPVPEDVVSYFRQFNPDVTAEDVGAMVQQPLMERFMSPAPAAGGGDTSRFMERDPIMAYRGGGMAGMKKHMGAYGHGGMGGMGAYEEGGMTGSKKNLSLRDENIRATAAVLFADFRGQDVTEEDKRAAYTRMHDARNKQARADPLFAEALKTRDDPSYTPTSPFFRPGQPSIEELESGPGSIATFAEYSKWAKGELDRLAKGGAQTRGADYYWGFTPTSEEDLPQAYEYFVDRRIKNIQMKDISDEAGQMVDAMLGKSQSYFDQPTEDIGGISAYRYGGMTGSKKKINKYAEGGLAPRIVGETGPEIALVGEEGPELVMTAKQTRDLLAILGQPGEMSEIKSVPIAAYDEGGVTGTGGGRRTYTEIFQSLQRDPSYMMDPLTSSLYNEETRAYDLSEEELGSLVRRAAPQGGDLDTGSLQSLVSELQAAEPDSALAYDPSVGEMLLATTAETLGNPYVAGALTAASFIPGGAMARVGATGLRTVAAREAAEQGAARLAARTGASGASRVMPRGSVPPQRMPVGSVPPVRTGNLGPVPPARPIGGGPPIQVPPPVRTVDEATDALATLMPGQQAAVQQNLRQRLASEGVEDLTDAEFAALVRAATERRLASSGPTSFGRALDDVPDILSNSRIANALVGAVDDVVRVANPTYGRLATGSLLLGTATGQYPGQESIFESLFGRNAVMERIQEQMEEEDYLARDQAMQELSIAMDRYGRDSDNIEAFTTYGGAATTMQSALNRIERKMERGTPLTAIEEATLRDPRSVLYLYQTYGTLRGQAAQDMIANINAGGRGTGARDVELQEQRVLYPHLYEQ